MQDLAKKTLVLFRNTPFTISSHRLITYQSGKNTTIVLLMIEGFFKGYKNDPKNRKFGIYENVMSSANNHATLRACYDEP